jgi:hypothetical protein
MHPTEYHVDVVFIHGLGGDWQGTWSAGKTATHSWPYWLATDVPEARVWCAQYPASAIGWTGRSLRSLAASTSLLDRMALNGLGEKPIVFVCHSLGGLVAKQLLRTGFDRPATPEWRKIGKATKGIVFLATPHSGSGLASLIDNFAQALGLVGSLLRVTDVLKELKKNSDLLEDLGDWYRAAAIDYKIATLVYAEAHPVKGIVMVVPLPSSNPGIARVKPIEVAFDHFEICKPLDRDHQVYGGTVAFVRRRIQKKKAVQEKPRLPKPVVGPRLELMLTAPSTPVKIPKLIAGSEPVVSSVDVTAAQMGLMPRNWVREILSQRVEGEQAEASAQKQLIDYASALAEWYRLALVFAGMQLRGDTETARVVELSFRLLNTGTQPAENPEIELWIAPKRKLHSSRPSRSGFSVFVTEAPVPPSGLEIPMPKTTKRPDIDFYDLPASAPYNPRLEHLSVDNVEEGHASLGVRSSSLQHGKTISFSPIYVLIGEHLAEDLTLTYKLFATNQPSVSEGSFEVKVID